MTILSTLRVYFHIDEPGRDAITAVALKKHLIKKNIKLVYGNRKLTSALFKCSLTSAFDIIILPRPMFIPKSINKRAIKAKIMILPTESIGRVASRKNDRFVAFSILDQEYMEGDTLQVDQVDRFFLWSESVKSSIVSLFPSLSQKLSVVGHPRFDALIVRPLVQRRSTSKQKVRRVGLITRFPLLNDFDNRSVIESIIKSAIKNNPSDNFEYQNSQTQDSLSKQDPNIVDELYKQASDIFVMMTMVSRLVEEGSLVEIKVHPRESYGAWEKILDQLGLGNSVRLVDRNTPFPIWVRHLDYVIGPASTSFYECINLNVTPICTKNIDKKRAAHLGPNDEEDIDLIKYIYCPSNIEDLLDYLDRGTKLDVNASLLDILSKETMYPKAKSSLSIVAEECSDEVQERCRYRTLLQGSVFLLFLLANLLYNLAVKLRKRRFNLVLESSSFILDRRARAFIDSLLDIPNRAEQ